MSEKVEHYKAVYPERDPEWEGSEVVIRKEEKIGHGGFADIFEVQAMVHDKPCNGVVKRYRCGFNEKIDEKSIQDAVNRAVGMYQLVREAGLPVFSTFRTAADRKSIFMTNGNTESTVCVSGPRQNKLYLLEQRTDALSKNREIKNLDIFFVKLYGCVVQASKKGLFLQQDSYMFLLNHDEQIVDFVIGDFDSIVSDDRNFSDVYSADYAALLAKNKIELFVALRSFFEDYYADKAEEYKYQVTQKLDIHLGLHDHIL